MKRTGSIGSRVPPAETSTRRPSHGPIGPGSCLLDRVEQRARLGQPADPVLAAGGECALLRLDHRDAALAKRRQVGLGRGVAVHPVVHRRSDQPGGLRRPGRRW